MNTVHEVTNLAIEDVARVQVEVDEAFVIVRLTNGNGDTVQQWSFPGADRKPPEGDNALELYADVLVRTITERWEHLTYSDETRHCLRLLRVAAVMFLDSVGPNGLGGAF